MRKLAFQIITVFFLALLCGCGRQEEAESMKEVADRVFSVAARQCEGMAAQLDSLHTPRSFDGTKLITARARWWCSGFFPGTLWLVYEYTGDENIRALAERETAKVEPMKWVTTDHDVGFQINCSFGQQYRITGDPHAREVMQTAARSLATRFNPMVGCIRSWDFQLHGSQWQFPVIIDNMMNLELLMSVAERENEPALADVAVSHANATMKNHYRPDYTTYHLVDYNPADGSVNRKQTVQGYADESAWARGQAWSLYGFTMMYRFTRDTVYLGRAEKVADMLLTRLPEDGIPYWDFDSPKIPDEYKDASAAAVMASAFIELAGYVPDGTPYRKMAERQLRTLSSDEYLAEPGTNGCFILKHSVGNMPGNSEVDVPLSYADYYFLEALGKFRLPDWDAALDKAHPRLLMSDANLKKLRKNIRRNRDVRLLHDSIIAHADECVDDTLRLSYRLDASGTRLLEQSRSALERIFFCAYAWRMTGKDKYLSRVREDMLTVCAFPDWHPEHFLDTGEMALAVAIGLDWCYGGLPAEVRDEAAAALERFALGQYKGQWFTTKANNWNQVCYCGLAAAALAAYEWYPSVSRDLLESAVAGNRKAMRMYGPDGVYPEGYVYWSYGTGFETMLLEMLSGVYGTDAGLSDAPGFMNTGTYMKYMVGTSGKCFSYFDSDEELYPLYAMWWFAARLSRPDLLDVELDMLRSGRYFEDRDWMRFAVFSACMASKFSMPGKKSSADGDIMFSGDGPEPVVLIRTGWKGAPEERYLAFKGGKASHSHGHMDAGSFVYDAFGMRWACDLGTQPYPPVEKAFAKYGKSFWSMKQHSFRWKVFRLSNQAHNTLTVNSLQHNVAGEAKIFDIVDTDEARGGSIDLTPVFEGQLSSAYRKIMLIDNNCLSVSDSLTALPDTPADIEWRMVTPAAATVTPNGILLEQGGRSLLLSAASDDPSIGLEYRIWPAAGTEEWDIPNPGKCIVGYSAAIPAGKSCTIRVSL